MEKCKPGSTGKSHSKRQKNRFTPSCLKKSPGFEEGPKKWSFVPFASKDNEILDALLEDILIILTKSPMNATLNLFDPSNLANNANRRKEIRSFLNKNDKFKIIYKSIPFFEWLTQTKYKPQPSFPVQQIINKLLLSIKLSRDKQVTQKIFAHKQIVFQKFHVQPKLKELYDKIKKDGSKNKIIPRGQLYHFSIPQTDDNKWMFQSTADT